jgi:chromosome segregation ATPase
MIPRVSILQWLELLLALVVAVVLAPVKKAELRTRPSTVAPRAAGLPAQVEDREIRAQNSFQVGADLREVQDRLAQASLEQFTRQNDLSKLEGSRRQDMDRAADLRTRIQQVSRDLIAAREERDATSREILNSQARQDATVEAQNVVESDRLAAMEAELKDRSVAARVALDRVLFLESLNYESDELAAAREKSRLSTADRDRLAAEVERLRTDLRLKELAATESRDWMLSQHQSDVFRNYDARVRQLQVQSAALQDELDAIELRSEQGREKSAQLEDELRRNQQQVDALEERRSRLLTELRSSASEDQQRPS